MVLAEVVASGAAGDVSAGELDDVEIRPSRPERLQGKAFSDGIAIGHAVLHEPHAPLGRVIADDPVKEEQRLDAALAQVRASLQEMLDGDPGRISGVSRDVLETFLMLASDPSWQARLKSGVKAGLSADAAVERLRHDHRAKLNASKDPYLRDRLHDLEDLDNRLLRALAGVDGAAATHLPPDAILIARDLGPAELLDYGGRLKGVALEEGASSGHAAIVARALGLPMVGLLPNLLSRVEAGDAVVLDGELGEVRLRAEPASRQLSSALVAAFCSRGGVCAPQGNPGGDARRAADYAAVECGTGARRAPSRRGRRGGHRAFPHRVSVHGLRDAAAA